MSCKCQNKRDPRILRRKEEAKPEKTPTVFLQFIFALVYVGLDLEQQLTAVGGSEWQLTAVGGILVISG